MKRIKRGLRKILKVYMLNNDNYVPIYTGDKLIGFGMRGGE